MDFQNRPGGKTGTGGVASWSEANRDRRERLRQLALETIDLNKDPYFMKNHLGSYECKLCLTLHNNEGSYLAHTQGKKHQANLARRAAKEAKDSPQQPAPEKPRVEPKKFVKIGRPGYRVTKQRDPENTQQSLLFQIDYPEIADGVGPRHRFMSAYEQRVEPPDRKWQYLLFAAEPYETISFKLPRGWRPGAIALGVKKRSFRIRSFSEPLATPISSKVKKTKKRVKTAESSMVQMRSESIASDLQMKIPPTLTVRKEGGVYKLTMQPIPGENTEGEEPVQVKIAEDCSESKVLEGSSGSSLQIEYMATGALRKPTVKPEVAEMGTQWDTGDFQTKDAVKRAEEPVPEAKKEEKKKKKKPVKLEEGATEQKASAEYPKTNSDIDKLAKGNDGAKDKPGKIK